MGFYKILKDRVLIPN